MGGSSASALMAVFGSRFHTLLDALCRLKSQVRDLHESVMAVFFDTRAHHVERRRLLCLSPQITHSTSCDPNQKMNLISEVYMHASLWTNSLSKNTHKYNMPLILESWLWMGFSFIGMCAHIWQIPKPEQCASGQHWRHGVQQHPQIAGWVNPEAGLRDTTRKVCYWDTGMIMHVKAWHVKEYIPEGEIRSCTNKIWSCTNKISAQEMDESF